MTTQENFKSELGWHAVGLNSNSEFETVKRIKVAGFAAHCPAYRKRYRTGSRRGSLERQKMAPLFPGYIFVEPNDAFQKELFETLQVRLIVLRKKIISQAQMGVIDATASALTEAQARSAETLHIKKGDIMQLLHGAWMGEPIEALEVRKQRILVAFKAKPWFPVWVSKSSVGRAV